MVAIEPLALVGLIVIVSLIVHAVLVAVDTSDPDPETKARLDALEVNRNGEKTQRHHHYLKGTLFCDRCRARISLTFANGNGGVYPYFYCLGRASGNGSDQPYLPSDDVERQILSFYQSQQVDPELVQVLRDLMLKQVRANKRRLIAEAKNQALKQDKLRAQQQKLLEAHYEDLIDRELFSKEQRRIRREMAEVERAQILATQEWDGIEAAMDDLFAQVHAGRISS